MANHRYTIGLVLCFLFHHSFAQTPLNISFKAGLLRGKEIVYSKAISTYDRESYADEPNTNFSLGFSLPIKGGFRVGAEIGLLSFATFFKYNYTYPNNAIEYIDGRYKINQAFVAVVPEYRITKWLYLNAGAGFYADYHSSFTDGTSTLGADSHSITGLENKRSNSFGFLAGIGLCPNITKELALLAEIRYTGSPASAASPYEIGVGYGAVNFNIGVMFKPRL